MANILLTPSVIANAAIATLSENAVMAGLVHRDYEEEFQAKIGTTVTVRKPTVFEAQEFTTAITVQNAVETSVPVVLNHHADVSFAVTSADLTLKIKDFSAQFLIPAMEAINQKIDRDLLTLRNDLVQEVGTKGAVTSGVDGTNEWDWDNPRVTIDGDRVLNANNVPPSQRYVVVGPTTKARWLGDDLMSKVNERGDTDGLRDASLGNKVYGFLPYMDQNITGSNEQSVMFHKTAFALVMRPLALPKGAAQAAYANFKGFGLRVVMDYDINAKQDVISIDTLYGVKTLSPERAVLSWANAS